MYDWLFRRSEQTLMRIALFALRYRTVWRRRGLHTVVWSVVDRDVRIYHVSLNWTPVRGGSASLSVSGTGQVVLDHLDQLTKEIEKNPWRFEDWGRKESEPK